MKYSTLNKVSLGGWIFSSHAVTIKLTISYAITNCLETEIIITIRRKASTVVNLIMSSHLIKIKHL
jgi:hypothetical protein